MIRIIRISIAAWAIGTEVFRENAIDFLQRVDVSGSPEKVFLINRFDSFLYQLELMNAERIDIMNAWFEIVKHVVESKAIPERSVNVLSSSFSALHMDRKIDLFRDIVRKHVWILGMSGLDILGLIPVNAFPDFDIIREIINLMISTGSVGLPEQFPYQKRRDQLEEILLIFQTLNADYTRLQYQNADMTIEYYPITMFHLHLQNDEQLISEDLIEAMRLLVPVERLIFDRFASSLYAGFSSGSVDPIKFELFRIVYRKLRIDPHETRGILDQLFQDMLDLSYLPSVQERVDEAIYALESMRGPTVSEINRLVREPVQISNIVLLVSPQIVGLIALLKRLAGGEVFSIIRPSFERWVLGSHPARILEAGYSLRAHSVIFGFEVCDLADHLASSYGINIYDSGIQCDIWRSEFVEELIAQDPRISVFPGPSQSLTEPVARFLMRFRRASFVRSESRLFASILSLITSNGSHEDILLTRGEVAFYAAEARDVVYCSLLDDAAFIVLDEFLLCKGVDSTLSLLTDSKKVLKLQFDLFQLNRKRSAWFQYARSAVESLFWYILINGFNGDGFQDFHLVSKQIERLIDIIARDPHLYLDEALRLEVIYRDLSMSPPESDSWKSHVHLIETTIDNAKGIRKPYP